MRFIILEYKATKEPKLTKLNIFGKPVFQRIVYIIVTIVHSRNTVFLLG